MVLGPDGITTGASNDIEQATRLARNMVTKWGLSEKLGPLKYDEDDAEVFLGMSAGTKTKAISADTARLIDEEVRRIIDQCYKHAENILNSNADKLHLMADALMEYETLNADQIDDIMAGAKPRAPSDGSGPANRAKGERPSSRSPAARATSVAPPKNTDPSGGGVDGARPRLFCSVATQQLSLAKPCVMGILNVTPDSFSDGGRFLRAGRIGCRRGRCRGG